MQRSSSSISVASHLFLCSTLSLFVLLKLYSFTPSTLSLFNSPQPYGCFFISLLLSLSFWSKQMDTDATSQQEHARWCSDPVPSASCYRHKCWKPEFGHLVRRHVEICLGKSGEILKGLIKLFMNRSSQAQSLLFRCVCDCVQHQSVLTLRLILLCGGFLVFLWCGKW